MTQKDGTWAFREDPKNPAIVLTNNVEFNNFDRQSMPFISGCVFKEEISKMIL